MPRIRFRKELALPTEREFWELIIADHCTPERKQEILANVAALRRKLSRCAKLDQLANLKSVGWPRRWSAERIAEAEAALADPQGFVEREGEEAGNDE